MHACSHALLRLPTPQTAVKAAIDKWEEANGELARCLVREHHEKGELVCGGRKGLCAQMPGHAGRVT